MKKALAKDAALWFFGLGALACLVVSVPATATAMELFHGFAWGWIATAVFEFGAVGAELSTLAIPQWRKRLLVLTVVLLAATTGANYALGIDEFLKTKLLPASTYAAIRANGYGPALALVASALFPSLLLVFLTAFTARWRMLRAGLDTSWRAVAFWVSTFGAWLNTQVERSEHALHDAEQRALLAEQRAIDLEHRLEQTRHELSTRPPAQEIEVIRVVRAQLTLDQAAALFGVSKSTVRRKLPLIEQVEK